MSTKFELKDLQNAAIALGKATVLPKPHKRGFTIEQWKAYRDYSHLFSYLDWTDEELNNAKNGFIGVKCGIECYITKY